MPVTPDNPLPWRDVSYPITETMVGWLGQPRVALERLSSIAEGQNANVSALRLSLHTGTHMDAPLHFLEDGPDITAAPYSVMFGPVRVAQIAGRAVDREGVLAYEARSAPLEGGERIFFRTTNSERSWLDAPFDETYVAVAPEAAAYLAAKKLATVGVDYLSVAPFTNTTDTHRLLLGAGVWIIEGLDLRAVAEGHYEMVALPLKIAGGDASPVRVLLRQTDAGVPETVVG